MKHRRRPVVVNSSIKTNKSDFIDKKLIDKVSLWILRIILKLGAHKEFIDGNNNFSREGLVYFLGLEKYAHLYPEKYTRGEVLDILNIDLVKLEKQKKFKSHKLLSKNITQISSLMNLNKTEEQVLEFVVLMKQYELLDDAVVIKPY